MIIVQGFTFMLWLVLISGYTVYVKWFLSYEKFEFPFFATLLYSLANCLLLTTLYCIRVTKGWVRWTPLTLLVIVVSFGSTFCFHLSLIYFPLVVQQILRAPIPVFIWVLTRCTQRDYEPGWSKSISALGVVVGAGMSLFGVQSLLALAALILFGLMSTLRAITMKKALSSDENTVFGLSLVSHAVSVVLAAAGTVVLEWNHGLSDQFAVQPLAFTSVTSLVLLVVGATTLHMHLIHQFSDMSVIFIERLQIVFVVGLGLVVYLEEFLRFGWWVYMGIGLSLISMIVYSYIDYSEKRGKKQKTDDEDMVSLTGVESSSESSLDVATILPVTPGREHKFSDFIH